MGNDLVTGFRRVWYIVRNMLLLGFLLLVATGLTGCDSAKNRAEAEAIRSEAQMQAMATRQALQIEATAAAIEAYEDLEMQPQRIQNQRTREHWLNLALVAVLISLAVIGVVWAAGEVRARLARTLNAAQSYQPDPRTGALPVVRVEHAPGRAARLAHEAAPLIRILRSDYLPAPLQYSTTLIDLDSGTQIRLLQVVDAQGRLHVWQENQIAPPVQQALVHHTRRVGTMGHAIAKMKQRHASAGEITQAMLQVGHVPASEPGHSSDGDSINQIRVGDYRYVEQRGNSDNGYRESWTEKA